MSRLSAKLHRKLYRAKAIDQAIRAASETMDEVEISRAREGDHHVVTVTGSDNDDIGEILAEICDLALQATVEQDRR